VLAAHEVQRLAGHSYARTTARYTHAKADLQQVERLARVFDAGTTAALVESQQLASLRRLGRAL
jgi:hypothetical protein